MQSITLLHELGNIVPLAILAGSWCAYVLLGRRWLRGAWNMRLFP